MKDSDEFYKVKPREQTGRDTFSRYKAQARAAGLESLSILDGQEVERVFCDYHDDFVVKRRKDGVIRYDFYQVKTKGKTNENWTLGEIFGLSSKIQNQSKQDSKKIKQSFAGKLLQHTVNFPNTCGNVVFMTNTHVDDNVGTLAECASIKDISNKHLKAILDKFNECFVPDDLPKLTEDQVLELAAKLIFETDVQHIKEKNNNFESTARAKIFEYSEIDLRYNEAQEILISLLNAIEEKSSGIIDDFTESEINLRASISINELLDILSISRTAYFKLLEGGDSKAIKSASVIQRTLEKAGASVEQVEFCSNCKTSWDIWLRENRNKISELDIMDITSSIDSMLREMISNSNNFSVSILRPKISALLTAFKLKDVSFDLTESLLLGGFFSALVRYKS
ncbi:dsDNA nuclease domain-containing protein [Pseudomonas sp. BN411]|uniref:dsDNA nuclease domain-containing protein n=1 Tax=Pseudomonas sp. BN411 TaxID=2567887 RepID=UPI002458C227|nr:dsDNA nuclease domain-containing protein [Pseudomonas sp. BN411]MDH4560784.1 DUF4297 domain-containing protein [Pseudomonas sp. BN411]